MAKKVVTNDGKKGGWLVGKRHYDKNGKSLGGIKAVVTDAGGKPVELEGGEVIINREASKKYWKELSRINQSAGNGVPIEPPSDAFDEDPSEDYENGGKIEFNANHIPNKWILNYAIKIKEEHPDVWALGGNIFGNQAFINLKRVAERGHWLDSEEWMYKKWRSFVARHKGDFRIQGVIAMLKWVDKVDRGWQYMKNLIEEEIKKREARKSKKMKDGGNVENKGIFHNLKKNIARGVLDDSYDLVKSKTDKRAISRAEKIIRDRYNNGGNLSKTPAPKSERIKGSKTNPKGTAKDSKFGASIKFDENTLASIKSLIDSHNEKYPSKKITLGVAKAVVRRGMGAYSSTHRPTITGGKPNSRTAWGLARLKAFIHKAEKGKSKSKKYSQDNDLFDDLNIKVSKFATGGLIAPNGKPSKLTPEQYKLVRTPEFKAWFGDWENDPKNASKVVDENGEPLVVYRGDSSASKKGFVFKTGFNRMGFINKSRLPNQYFHYFVNNYDVALGYANDQIYDHNFKVEETGKGKIWQAQVTPYFLSIKNPIDITPNNPLFPTFKEYEDVLKHEVGKEWFEKNEKFRTGYDYGKLISSSELNKIFEDKLGKNYLDNTASSNISTWQKQSFQNDLQRNQSYSFFVELKGYDTGSAVLRKVYENMLKKNIDGLMFLETTHWKTDFIENWSKYKSGELKYDYKRWVEKPKVFAALESNQIKLADGTNITFDENNPDIRFEDGGNLDLNNKRFVVKPRIKFGMIYGYLVYDTFEKRNLPYEFNEEEEWKAKRRAELSNALWENKKMEDGGNVDAKDSVTIDIPLMIRLLELSREDIKSDAELHFVVENLLKLKNKPVLTMDDYAFIADVEHNHLKKYDLGGKMPEVERTVDLGFGGLGNGTTVWDRNRIHNNDYKIVAHISNEGKITYYDKKLPEYAINQIESMAENDKKRYEDMNGLSTGYDFNPIQTPLN